MFQFVGEKVMDVFLEKLFLVVRDIANLVRSLPHREMAIG